MQIRHLVGLLTASNPLEEGAVCHRICWHVAKCISPKVPVKQRQSRFSVSFGTIMTAKDVSDSMHDHYGYYRRMQTYFCLPGLHPSRDGCSSTIYTAAKQLPGMMDIGSGRQERVTYHLPPSGSVSTKLREPKVVV